MCTLALVILLAAAVAGFPDGPPVFLYGVCEEMEPWGHGVSNASSWVPYRFWVGNDTEGNIEVGLYSPWGYAMKGFFIQARPVNSTVVGNKTFGRFHAISYGSQVLSCGSGYDNAIGHYDSSTKYEVQTVWVPPANSHGYMRFRATVVHGPASIYWTDIYSREIPYGLVARGGNLKSSMMVLVLCAFGGVTLTQFK